MVEIVNGYPCSNCTDVENAKKGIDPAHPKASKDAGAPPRASSYGEAVKLDGSFSGRVEEPEDGTRTDEGDERARGSQVDVSA
ncbi:MAG: hypothetical protein H6923_03245 [Alphaproteobacteria bacterium]|nr:hypothetical protein [Alphaproteobacteria bacterium]